MIDLLLSDSRFFVEGNRRLKTLSEVGGVADRRPEIVTVRKTPGCYTSLSPVGRPLVYCVIHNAH
jgi:hypothetical protein